ncbi:MAG: AzlC family ABC transporter permease, partial [Gordonia sp. (in: high G+C Gram-positive bacteria)]
MRSLWRTLDRATVRAIGVMYLSVFVIGMSYGVSGHSVGLTWWQLTLIATVVLAGSSEFVFLSVLVAGGAPWLGAAAGVLINTRNLGYGLAVGPSVGTGVRMLLGAHLINDESAALTAAQTEPTRARATFLLSGVGVLVTWPAGALLGAVLGNLVADPAVLGLD